MSQNACDEPIVVPPGPGKGIVGSGSLGIVPKTGTYVTTWTNPNIGNPIDGEKFLKPTTVISVGYVIPNGVVEIGPVANTSNFPTVDANGNVDYVDFANKMKENANQIVSQLQSLQSAKAAAIAAGPDGPSCDEDVEYPANTFTIEVKSKFEVIPCVDPVPCEFTCSTFTVTGDDTVTITNGTITITLNGGTLTLSGVTTLDLPSVTTIGGEEIATAADIANADFVSTSTFNNHRHNYEDGANTQTTETTGTPV